MEMLQASLALCEGSPLVTRHRSPVDSSHKEPEMRSFDFYVLMTWTSVEQKDELPRKVTAKDNGVLMNTC